MTTPTPQEIASELLKEIDGRCPFCFMASSLENLIYSSHKEKIIKALTEAVEAETERCAKVAQDFFTESISPMQNHAGIKIATAIRNRSKI